MYVHVWFAPAQRALEMTIRVVPAWKQTSAIYRKNVFRELNYEICFLIYYKKSNERRIMKICTHFNQVYFKLLK